MALIKNIDEIKNYCSGITNAVSFSAILPSINKIENRVIKRHYLGDALYNDLQAALDINTLSPAQTELLKYVQAALAPLAVANFTNSTLSEIGDAGPREVNSENATGVRLWVVNKQTKTFVEDGEEALNDLLDHLEDNYFNLPMWNQSTAFTGLHYALLNSAKLFNEYVFINRSHAFFKAIKPIIKIVETRTIKETIGAAFYGSLLAKKAEQTATTEEKEAINFACRAIAHFVIAFSKLPVTLGNDGAVVITPNNTSQAEQRVTVAAPSGFDADQYKAQMLDDARTYLQDLRKYLDATSSASIMPLYYNSNLRQETASATYNSPMIDNTSFTGIYVL